MNLEKAKEYWADMSNELRQEVAEKVKGTEAERDFSLWLEKQPEDQTLIVSYMLPVTKEEPLDAKGRFAVKNLSSDMDAAVEYLKQQNPDINDLRIKDGRIVGRRKGDKYDKYLDPNTLEWADITDLLYDTGAAAATTGASIAGGPAGGFGMGAISEFLKQRLGQMFMPQKDDYGKVLVSGGLSAIPGSGKMVGAGIKKIAPKVAPYAGRIGQTLGGGVGAGVGQKLFGTPGAMAGGGGGAYLGQKLGERLFTPKDPRIALEALFAKPSLMSRAINSPYPEYLYQLGAREATNP